LEYLKETGPHDPDRPTRLENCDDIVHLSCLHEYLLSAIDENKFPIKCVNHECNKLIAHADIQKVLEVEEYERFIRFLTKAMKLDMEGAIDCPNLDCDFFFDNGTNEKQGYFKCIACSQEYCLTCEIPWHEGKTCAEIKAEGLAKKEDEEMRAMLEEMNWRKCPKCGFAVGKDDGCNRIPCRCGHSFCYLCGADWDFGPYRCVTGVCPPWP
jgi:hypothetical protein